MITKDNKIADVVRDIPGIDKVFEKNHIKIHGWGSMANNRIGDAARKKGVELDSLLNELHQYEKSH